MAEDSAFWSGTTVGDAASADKWAAPYSDVEFEDIMSKLLMSNDNVAFVVPGYLNNLKTIASTPVAMTVEVQTGALTVQGRIYENTATNTLTIAANATGNPRIDRIIARINFASQTIRLFVLQGTAAATPALPTLTQTAVTYEVPIAYVWVANAAASIADTDIHDEREFLCTSANFNDSYNVGNLISNSEFMGFSQLSGGATTNPPDTWNLVGTPSDVANYTRPSQMSRGRAIQITTDAASEGVSQTFPVKASTAYSIKLLTRVTASDVGSISVTTNSAAPGTITRYSRRTGAWFEERIFYITEADASTMTISLMGLNSSDVVQYGQVLVIEGWVPGPFRQIREVVLFTEGISDANWSSDVYATGTTTITLSADFQALILAGTRSVYVAIEASGSASSVQGTVVTAMPYEWAAGNYWITLYLTGVPNNTLKATQGWVAIDSSLRFKLDRTALGGSNVTVTLLLIGIMI